MTDVLLIHPPTPPTVIFLPLFPLGLGYLASSLENNGLEVKVLDLNVEDMNYEKVKKVISSFNPSIIGISSTSLTLPFTLKLAQLIKSELDVPICIGGPHASVDPTFVHRFKNFFDYQIIGEGEITFPWLVRKILKNKKIRKKVFFGKPVQNLDSLLFPAYHLFPMKKYTRHTGIILSSRGCPYSCIFCSLHSEKVRFRTPRNVIEELKLLKEEYKIEKIEFEDNNFTINRKRVIDFCNQLLKEKLEIKWSCQTRSDLVDINILKIMKKSGCELISFGVETFSEKLQQKIKKNIPPNVSAQAILSVQKVGMKVGVNCLFGLPMEKREDIECTIHWLKKLKPNFVFPSFVVPFLGTEVFEILVKKGKIDKNIWDVYTRGLVPPPVSVSENFNRLLYFYYLIQILALFRIGVSTPKVVSIGHLLKLYPNLLSFTYKSKLFKYLKSFLLSNSQKLFLKSFE
ncbi:MAG: radical SAM protein [Candidatus Aenigmatarchaeota archaeon]